MQWIWTIFKENLPQNQRFCVETSLFRLTITIINKGDEIPLEHRSKIFERFYRVDSARNSDDNHYGLGLAIAKAIATSHKGHIAVHCYDGFVEFTVEIPTSQQ